MKTINESIDKYYSPIKVHIDDLNEIERIIKESCAGVEVDAAGFKFDSITEMVENLRGRSIIGVKITTSKPYATIDFMKLYTHLYVSSSDTLGSGLFHKLDQIVRRTRRPLWFFYTSYFAWGLGILLPVISSFILTDSKYYYTFVSLVFAWILWVVYVRLQRQSLVILTAQSSLGNLWTRKKDEIVIAVISAAIGAILGIIGTVLVNQLSK
jgi:hypothetical protein